MIFRSNGLVTKNEIAPGQGHSQVRLSGTLEINSVEYPVECILSTPNVEVLDAFTRAMPYGFVVQELAVVQPDPAAPAIAAATPVGAPGAPTK